MSRTIRLATYNIRKAIGLDWRRDPDRIVRVIAELRADVVALQEADRRFGARQGVLDPRHLRDLAGLSIAATDPAHPSHGFRGNVILAAKGIRVLRTEPLELPSLEPRGALVAHLKIGTARLRFAGVHLGLRRRDRRIQSEALLSFFEARRDGALEAIAGDLNERHPTGIPLDLLKRRFQPAPPERSFHASFAVLPLDRILAGTGLKLLRHGAHRSALARRASDHLPVWADYRIDVAESDTATKGAGA